jgi:hypothetical protein
MYRLGSFKPAKLFNAGIRRQAMLLHNYLLYCRYSEQVRPQEYAAVMPTVALDLVVCKSTVVGKVFEAS